MFGCILGSTGLTEADIGVVKGFRERGGRGGGRGGDGSGRGTAPARSAAVGVGDASEARLPYNYKVAQKLFTGEAELATDEPV